MSKQTKPTEQLDNNLSSHEIEICKDVKLYNSRRKVWKKKRIKPKVKYKQNIKVSDGIVNSYPYFSICFERLHWKILHEGEMLDDVHFYNLSFRWYPRTLVQDELTVMYMEEAAEQIKATNETVDLQDLKNMCIQKADAVFNMLCMAMDQLEKRGQSPFKWFELPLDFNTHNDRERKEGKERVITWDGDDEKNDETNGGEGQDDSWTNSTKIESKWWIIWRIFWG